MTFDKIINNNNNTLGIIHCTLTQIILFLHIKSSFYYTLLLSNTWLFYWHLLIGFLRIILNHLFFFLFLWSFWRFHFGFFILLSSLAHIPLWSIQLVMRFWLVLYITLCSYILLAQSLLFLLHSKLHFSLLYYIR